MKVLQINSFSNGSTGKIMFYIHNEMRALNIESYVAWGRGKKPENKYEISIYDNIGIKLHGLYTRILDRHGFASWHASNELVKRIEIIEPDIIHLHNIHGYYVNIEILFDALIKFNKPVVWTLHDCWPFTGHCAYFDFKGCFKWKFGCYNCVQKKTYPASIFYDNSQKNWIQKKRLFSNINLNLVCPSDWLANYVKQSFLAQYPCSVIRNGIDCNVFKNITINDIIKRKFKLNDKPIILGVASEWTPRKGLSDIYKLANLTNEYQIVVVGLNEQQIKEKPKNVIGIRRTDNQQELVSLYSSAYVLFNPTYEDNYPTVNLESQACLTPVITYNTGGSVESVPSNNIVEQGDIFTVLDKINQGNLYVKKDYIDKSFMTKQYIDLYKKALGNI